MKKNTTKIILTIIIMTIIFMLLVIFPKHIMLWTTGLSSISNNTKDYTNQDGYIIEEEYSISINLNELEKEIGKEIYNDGKNKIYIYDIDNTGDIGTGGYRIHFRSSGSYSLDYAELVSGVKHISDKDSSQYEISAELTAAYNNKLYECNVMGLSGNSHKGGDGFSYYIFPHKSYQNKEVTLNEPGVVKLTIKNLYKNVWVKK